MSMMMMMMMMMMGCIQARNYTAVCRPCNAGGSHCQWAHMGSLKRKAASLFQVVNCPELTACKSVNCSIVYVTAFKIVMANSAITV